MSSAASFQPRCSNISTPESSTEPGFTLSWPAYFGRRAVGRFEDAVSGDVVDVGARRDADAAHLRRQRVGEVVAVQVHRRDDVELASGASATCWRVMSAMASFTSSFAPGLPSQSSQPTATSANSSSHELVAPLHEGALGELLDVALVHEGDRLALVRRARS